MSNFQILEGDSIRLLSGFDAEVFDLGVADPPYSSGGTFRSDRCTPTANQKYLNAAHAKEYPEILGDSRDTHAWHRWAHLWLSECYRTIKTGGYMFLFSDWRQLTNAIDAFQVGGFIMRGLMSWDKGSQARLPNPGYFRHQCEYIVWGTKGPCQVPAHKRSSYDGSITLPVQLKDKTHPTEKPVGLYKHLLEAAPRGAHILDPFAGSGTSGQAALELGQRFTGFELSPEYAQIARNRLALVANPAEQLSLIHI